MCVCTLCPCTCVFNGRIHVAVCVLCLSTWLCAQVAGEHRFHPECFQCQKCLTYIGDGDTYALVERSRLFW